MADHYEQALRKLGLDASRARELALRAKPGAGHDPQTAPTTLCVHEGALLYTFDVKSGRAARISPDDATKYEVELSPDGQRVAFVRDHNLIVADARTGAETALSKDGSERMLYGRLDWVYQEEIYGRGDFRGHWWSPTGKHLAYLRLDESPVKPFMVVDHVPDRSLENERAVKPEPMNYPKAGDPNPIVSVGVADVATGETVWLQMPTGGGYDDEILVVYVDWDPRGDRVVFQVQNRIQTWLDLCYGDPKTGTVTDDTAKAVNAVKAGRIDYKIDKNANIAAARAAGRLPESGAVGIVGAPAWPVVAREHDRGLGPEELDRLTDVLRPGE